MIEHLRCPVTGSELKQLLEGQLAQLNGLIEQKQLVDNAGRTIENALESGLVNSEQSWIYPVRKGITSLTTDNAISAKVLNDE